MKEFIEKWKSDSKFKTKIKLSISSLFVLIVAIFAITSNEVNTSTNSAYTDGAQEQVNNEENNFEQEYLRITIPEEYTYITKILINNEQRSYRGTKNKQKENITKISNQTTNYIYQEGKYYKKENLEYVLTTKEEIYDIISNGYLKLETINKYLSKSHKKNDKNIVYIKDIILGSDSEEYITITIEKNKIQIDYTPLMHLFDNSIRSCMVEITIE